MTETSDTQEQVTAAETVAPVQPRSRKAKASAAQAEQVEFIDYTKPEDRKNKDRPPVLIRLHNSDNFPPNGQPFGVNGRHFALRPDVWYKVPGYLPLMLRDIVKEIPMRDDNNRFIGTRTVPAWPFEQREA